MIPGEIHFGDGDLTINEGYEAIKVVVKNTGDRAVQVGSHFHFYEANSALDFERKQGWGRHLDIAAGTAVRFEPGETKEVALVDYGGKRRVFGFNNMCNGFLDDDSYIE